MTQENKDKPEEKSRQDACATAPRHLSVGKPNPIQQWHSRGYLPHLTVEHGTYFVTFRLGDSLPHAVLERFQREREEMEDKLKGQSGSLNEHDLRKIERLYSEKVEQYLDAGAGCCALKRPDIAEAAVGALRHFDGERYLLHACVVMPNHIHVLLTPRTPHRLEDILHSWKSYTAKQANRMLGQAGGSFWQRESYDHLVRDDGEYIKLREYILMNPVNAGLCEKPEAWRYSSAGFQPASG